MKKLVCALVLISICLTALSGCGLTVPSPETKEGTFSYSVTYEIDGSASTVSGVYICKYNGTDWALDGGYHRDWLGYCEDGCNGVIEIGTVDDGGAIRLNLGLFPEYFMGDSYIDEPKPWLSVCYLNDEGNVGSVLHDEDALENEFGIKLIGYEYDEPIVNSFGLFK